MIQMATVSVLAVSRARSLVRFKRFFGPTTGSNLLPLLLNNNCQQLVRNSNTLRYCSSISDNVDVKAKNTSNPNVSNKAAKKAEETKITLLLPDNSMMITDLENASKISKRRGLILIKVEEVQKKTSRATYKLVKQAECYQKELDYEKEKENVIKNVKTIQLSSKITTHDLNIKLKNINKLLDKRHKVKIILMHGSSIQDKVIKSIEFTVKNHGMLQKTVKSTSTIFTITPNLNEHDDKNVHDVNTSNERKESLNLEST